MKNHFSEARLKKVGLFCLMIPIFVLASCSGGNGKKIVSVSPVKMNVFYLGVENPVSIAISGIPDADVTATIDNGTIVRKDDYYIVNPKTTGMAVITVHGKGKILGTSMFRVKSLPDPVATLLHMKDGLIDKATLLTAKEMNAQIENSDFEVPFKIVGFTVAATIKGFVREENSASGMLTKGQLSLIGMATKDNKIYFQDIKAIGPDSVTRNLGSLYFEIK